jgi:hypothetical protein
MDKKLAVKIHTGAGNLPEAWKSCADDLLAAAAVLREHRASVARGPEPAPNAWRTHPSELMLSGMAIECLLKALWVKQGHNLVADGKYVPVPGAGAHDLVQLAGVLKLTLSDLETDLLRRLSHFIEYGGRYPVPKNAEKLRLVSSPRGGRGAATTWATPSDQLLFDEVVNRLEQMLEANAPPNPALEPSARRQS